MKIWTFSLITLALLAASTGRAQFVPGPNPIAGTVSAAQTLHSGSGSLTFQNGSTYLYSFNANRNNSRADEVIANGVTIASGATLTIDRKIGGRLNIGTTFTLISNTAATPIAGSFANLPDGSIITIKGNNFQASYEGGDSNDLTLTVVP